MNSNENGPNEENLNNMENPIDIDNNFINDEIEHNPNNGEVDYMTDSDIEDEKYMPSGHVPKNLEEIENIENNINIEVPSQKEIILQNELMNLENDALIVKKELNKLENENEELKTELMKEQEKMESKENINNQFKQLLLAFKQRFNQYEKRNEYLQNYIKQLEENLKRKDIELIESLKDKNKYEAALKNSNIYKQYAKELENEFKEKSKKLNDKYIEKENNLKNKINENFTLDI